MLAIGLSLLRTVCEQHLELCAHIVVVANRPLSILRARQQIAFDHIVVDESKLGRETLLVVAALPDMDNRAVVLGGADARARPTCLYLWSWLRSTPRSGLYASAQATPRNASGRFIVPASLLATASVTARLGLQEGGGRDR